MAVITGRLLDDLNIVIPSLFLYFFIATSIAGLIIYPSQKLKGIVICREAFYIRQKFCDLVLIASTFLMIVYGANHFDGFGLNYSAISAAIPVNRSVTVDSSTCNYKPIEAFRASMKNKDGKTLRWKERRKLLKTQLNEIRRTDDLPVGAKIALTIACVLVAAGLSTLLAAAACSLSCSGSEALAVVVGLGGAVVIILLLVWALRAIYGKKKKKKEPPTDIVPENNN